MVALRSAESGTWVSDTSIILRPVKSWNSHSLSSINVRTSFSFEEKNTAKVPNKHTKSVKITGNKILMTLDSDGLSDWFLGLFGPFGKLGGYRFSCKNCGI